MFVYANIDGIEPGPAIRPRRAEPLDRLEFVKGPDRTAPVVMAVTLEAPAAESPAGR